MKRRSPIERPLGPLLFDPLGYELDASTRERLEHPLTGGVILFSRNYADHEQLRALTTEIHALRSPPLLVTVDHEGGRVQRFRDGFTRLPAVQLIGAGYADSPETALAQAEWSGWVMAAELRAHGVDFSYTPVLDVSLCESDVIGDRAWHHDPEAVGALASACIRGLARAGMAACGKHFPGHGGVGEDSHATLPRDARTLEAIEACDLVPYRAAFAAGLKAVMTAHVHYEQLDDQPPTYSRFWIHDVLRQRLGFNGAVFSDDLSMEGAGGYAAPEDRARAALEAGCDLILVCNDEAAVDRVLDRVSSPAVDSQTLAEILARREALIPDQRIDPLAVQALSEWRDARRRIAVQA